MIVRNHLNTTWLWLWNESFDLLLEDVDTYGNHFDFFFVFDFSHCILIKLKKRKVEILARIPKRRKFEILHEKKDRNKCTKSSDFFLFCIFMSISGLYAFSTFCVGASLFREMNSTFRFSCFRFIISIFHLIISFYHKDVFFS